MNIRVIGAYLPRLAQNSINQFILHEVTEYKTFWIERIQSGKSDWSIEGVEEGALDLSDALNTDLQKCAMFEVEVTDNSQKFYASDFSNLVTGLCGWEPAYLSLDGESVIADGVWISSEIKSFRVVFYIHEWEELGRLSGPTGELSLPPFSAAPARLWRLAPYSCVD